MNPAPQFRLTSNPVRLLVLPALLVCLGCTSSSGRLPFNPFASKSEAEDPNWLSEKAGLADRSVEPENMLEAEGGSLANSSQGAAPESRATSRVEPARTEAILRSASQTANDEGRSVPKPDASLTPAMVAPASGAEPADAQLVSASARPSIPPLMTLENARDLQTVLSQTPGVVILDFYADWCGPCKDQAKILHSLQATAARNQATIVKIDIEQFPQLKEQFQVQKMPTLYVFKQGQLLHRQVGKAREDQLAGWLAE